MRSPCRAKARWDSQEIGAEVDVADIESEAETGAEEAAVRMNPAETSWSLAVIGRSSSARWGDGSDGD